MAEWDIFGVKKRHEAKKSALKREIEAIVNTSAAESQGVIQDWDTKDQNEGRNQKVSYRTLEQIYKKESWVRACIDAIQRTSTSNGFKLVTKDPYDPNELTEQETNDIIKLLRNPNSNDSFSDIISEVAVDLHLYGDAYMEIVKDDKGIPIALYNIYAPSVKILVNRHGTVLGYVQNANGASSGDKSVIFDATEVVHFKLPNPGNEVYGLSPLESLFTPIQTDLHAQNYNLKFFKNDATPRLHIDLGNCTLPQLKRTKEFFKSQFHGQPHKTLITEGGVKVSPIGTAPADMDFLKQRKFSRDEICAVFGVPPMKIGIFEDVNRASALESDKSFKSEKIIPLQRMIANKINLCIISLFNSPRVKFEFCELDLRDAKEQAQIDKIDIDSGILTVQEARRNRGLPAKVPNSEGQEENSTTEEKNLVNGKSKHLLFFR